MKINEITIVELKAYLHVYHNEDDALLTAILTASKAFVRNYTGLTDLAMNTHDDLSMVVFILSSDLYDNRVYTVEKDAVNPAIKTILNMHSVNLL